MDDADHKDADHKDADHRDADHRDAGHREVAVRPGGRRWPKSEAVWRQFALLDLTMERMGADPLTAARKGGGTRLANARRTCLGCPLHRQCRDLLEAGGDPADFCPNADFFAECRPGRRPA